MQLAVDGGATNLRMAVVEAGSITRQEVIPGYQWAAGEDPNERQCALVLKAWDALGRPGPVETIALGLAGGAIDPESRRQLAALLASRLNAGKVLLTGDPVTNHLGVLGGSPGVVIAAGTGVACLAVTAEGLLHNVDGLGYLFGDLGGGFSVGQAGLRAALAAIEGRGPQTSLVDRATRIAGSPLPQTIRTWYKRPTLTADVAAFSSEVSAASSEGDEVAIRICERAGHDLAESVVAAANTAFGHQLDVPVSWSGSVLRSPTIFQTFVSALREARPPVDLRDPLGDAMTGAVRLAQEPSVPHLVGVFTAPAGAPHTPE